MTNQNNVPTGGEYIITNGALYFVIGKNKIKVTEHFPDQGPSLTDLLESAIKYAEKTA